MEIIEGCFTPYYIQGFSSYGCQIVSFYYKVKNGASSNEMTSSRNRKRGFF